MGLGVGGTRRTPWEHVKFLSTSVRLYALTKGLENVVRSSSETKPSRTHLHQTN